MRTGRIFDRGLALLLAIGVLVLPAGAVHAGKQGGGAGAQAGAKGGKPPKPAPKPNPKPNPKPLPKPGPKPDASPPVRPPAQFQQRIPSQLRQVTREQVMQSRQLADAQARAQRPVRPVSPVEHAASQNFQRMWSSPRVQQDVRREMGLPPNAPLNDRQLARVRDFVRGESMRQAQQQADRQALSRRPPAQSRPVTIEHSRAQGPIVYSSLPPSPDGALMRSLGPSNAQARFRDLRRQSPVP